MPTKITLWIDKGKPTKVRTTRHVDFYMEDLSPLFAKAKEKGAEKDGKPKANQENPSD